MTKASDLTRRTMIVAGAGGTALWLAGCGKSARKGPDIPDDAASTFEIEEATIAAMGAAMAAGTLTAVQLTQMYLDRIEAMNRKGPELRAVIETNPKALEQAAALDGERKAGKVRGPLHGVPILIKDNIATDKSMETTAGSLALVGFKPPKPAFLVSQLERAGALVLGKANLSEWANIRSEKSTSGWSARGGRCRNPYVLDRNPCGSSSGSGAGVAANLCAAAIGTETSGSIICPSSHNNLVGLKPTVGAVSRAGVIPISPTQDTAGPMARTVADAFEVFRAIVGADPSDPTTGRDDSAQMRLALRKPLAPGALRGVRIGVARNMAGFNPEVDKLLDAAIGSMQKAGAVFVDPAPVELVENDAFEDVLLAELVSGLKGYLATLPEGAPRDLAAIVDFNNSNADRELAHFGQDLFDKALAGKSLADPALQKARADISRAAAQSIDAALAKHNVEAMIAPTNGPAWPTALEGGRLSADVYTGGSTAFTASGGYPNITVPMGFVGELPIGLSIFGTAFSDAWLCQLAFDFERVHPARRKPKYLPTVADAK